MDDHELSELLSDADRPRALRADERDRVRARLGLPAEASSPATSDELAEVPPVIGPPDAIDDFAAPVIELQPDIDQRAGNRPIVRLLAAAAALIAVVAIGLTQFQSAQEAVDTADDPAPAPALVPALVTFCPTEFTALVDGVDQWRGIENWSFSPTSQPDLLVLVDDAFSGLESIDDDRVQFDSDARARLAATLDADDGEFPILLEEARAREDAVTAAIATILDTVLTAGSSDAAGCDTDRLIELVGFARPEAAN
ncbi:MAG: hypothetical protein R8J94_11330 [Acidimicrobiia bacterium]|nr:hypothetical protein [Acidimicrobiia bacterium]